MTAPEPHRISFRVYYEDTDAGGIVYHANYLKFAERARVEAMRVSGWTPKRIADEFGMFFVVRHIEIDFRASARLDDLIEARTTLETIGSSSFTLRQEFWRGATLLVGLKIVLVTIDASGKPAVFPHLQELL